MTLNENRELLKNDESNPVYYNISEKKLLLPYGNINWEIHSEFAKVLLSRVESILLSKQYVKAFIYFLDKKAATTTLMIKELGMSSQTTYNIMRKLAQAGLVEPVMKVKSVRGGPKPILYALPNINHETIQQRCHDHNMANNKIYSHVMKVAQICLEHYRDEEMQFNKIVGLSRRYNITGFRFIDVANEVARVLTVDYGKKIWR